MNWKRETADVRARYAVAAWLAFIAAGVVHEGLLYWMVATHVRHAREKYRRTGVLERVIPPPPRLQVDPPADLLALRAEEDAWLTGYGWVDRAHGIAHIPVERAMDILLKRGLPARRAP